MAARQTKKTKRGKRYSDADKSRILAAATREGLTGAQVKKRFGVSTLTFYRWRGPVRGGRKARGLDSRGGVRRGTAAGNGELRDHVRQSVQAVLPGIIRQEVNAYLDRVLPRRGPGRPRKGG